MQPLQARRRSPVIAPDIAVGAGEEQVIAVCQTLHLLSCWRPAYLSDSILSSLLLSLESKLMRVPRPAGRVLQTHMLASREIQHVTCTAQCEQLSNGCGTTPCTYTVHIIFARRSCRTTPYHTVSMRSHM